MPKAKKLICPVNSVGYTSEGFGKDGVRCGNMVVAKTKRRDMFIECFDFYGSFQEPRSPDTKMPHEAKMSKPLV